MIQAIPTTYKGVRFRSRLEARWAILFDVLSIKWEYEPRKFKSPSGRYIPDFRVLAKYGIHVWIEIKPSSYILVTHDHNRYEYIAHITNGLVLIEGIELIPRFRVTCYYPNSIITGSRNKEGIEGFRYLERILGLEDIGIEYYMQGIAGHRFDWR